MTKETKASASSQDATYVCNEASFFKHVDRPHHNNIPHRRVGFDYSVEVSFSCNSSPSNVSEHSERARHLLLEQKRNHPSEPSRCLSEPSRRRQSRDQARSQMLRRRYPESPGLTDSEDERQSILFSDRTDDCESTARTRRQVCQLARLLREQRRNHPSEPSEYLSEPSRRRQSRVQARRHILCRRYPESPGLDL